MKPFAFAKPSDFVPRAFELFSKQAEPRYSLPSFGKDCLAGVIVGVVALPLAMAFSISAGCTPAQGLYTAIVAGFCISLLGGSRYQIGGPTGAFVVIIFGIVEKHGLEGLVAATVLAGLMLVAMGLTGIGRFIKYIPYPVTTGFTAGIGVLIFSQQVKDFFGFHITDGSPEFLEEWAGYLSHLTTLDPATLAVGAGTLALIVAVRRFFPRVPGAVVGVLAATLLCKALALPVETIGTRFGGIPQKLPLLTAPAFGWQTARAVLPDAFAVALLAAIESLLSAVVADGMTGDRHNANMELVAQGIGNIASAAFGGIPATGAIARTATNIKSGALSPVAGIVHALTLVLFILFLAPAASAIPLSSLAAVLIVVSWDMSNLPRFARILRRAPKSDAGVLLATCVLTVAVDLTFAVEIGMALAVALFLRRMIACAGIKAENDDLIAELAFGEIEAGTAREIVALHRSDIEVYEITGPFFFGVADMLQQTLRSVAPRPHTLILRMRDVPAVDSTGIAALESFLAQCRKRKIRVVLCEIREQPRKALEKAGFLAAVGADSLVAELGDALELAERRTAEGGT
ncbi:SulP family inorganic anion transporter [Treponema endosymbiont of Eucomonympha sp.]|uniref:SulP family inorganic anion transporter n=1 Tax=Treponema endosymbiont of Eucomonympha sp. TaxID=1580831 RepID=UPI00078276E3|nr:SulP family inorganic anion transporter [Treponema endosymbiont of Eucomonympha sp.]